MATADTDGVVEVDGIPRRIKAGQELPEGATVRQTTSPNMSRKLGQLKEEPTEQAQPPEQPARPETPRPDQRAKGAAPENRGRSQ